MGLISNYIDFVRGSYNEYGDAMVEQDLGVGADYEAITGEPFGPHVALTGIIGIASGKIWVGTVTHLGYHALERVYLGLVDLVFVNDIINRGDSTLPEVIDWLGEPASPVLPGMTRGDVVVEAASKAGRFYIARQRKIRGQCPSKNWRGKRCSLYRGHSVRGHNY